MKYRLPLVILKSSNSCKFGIPFGRFDRYIMRLGMCFYRVIMFESVIFCLLPGHWVKTISVELFLNHLPIYQAWAKCMQNNGFCKFICYFYIHQFSIWLIVKLLFCSQLDSNNLSGRIPQHLFQVPKYKYGW